jgi:hypothetical protein
LYGATASLLEQLFGATALEHLFGATALEHLFGATASPLEHLFGAALLLERFTRVFGLTPYTVCILSGGSPWSAL